MPKWSDYIRNLGTAGPATLQGIYNLGFALRSEFPALVAKFLRVDQTQNFTAPERLQGRDNLGLGTISTQAANSVAITGGSITGITDLAIADGGTGASTASAARSNLGLGNVDNTSDAAKPISTLTQQALDLKAPLSSPLFTGDPKAPTPTPGDNDTSIATTAFVANALLSVARPLLALADQRTAGTNYGALNSGVNTRVINTVLLNEIVGASLSANQVTLPAGTYEIDALTTIYAVTGSISVLFNVTDAILAVSGLSVRVDASQAVNLPSPVRGRFTISSPKVFELRTNCGGTSGNGGGVAASLGIPEKYSDIMIRKVS